MNSLPIDEVLPELLARLRESNCAVLQAPPGAGKTTRVPPALLAAGHLTGPLLVVEPRRIAARGAARRMALEEGSVPGERFGWHVRFERQASARTRVLCVTPGILLRLMQEDPYLEKYGGIIFDEFHERGLETDLALGVARMVQGLRPSLQLLVMSATLDAQEVAQYLDDCPIITSSGRTFPVEIRYEPKREEDRWPSAAVKAVDRLIDQTEGDILVFLPGVGEIRAAQEEMESLAQEADILVLPLHGELPPEEQDRAILPQRRRKVILSTNVAETSVTIEGVTAVVDTGLARQMQFDPTVGLDRLQLVNISKASCDQRAGRAGRTRPGICIRLWSEVSHRSRRDATPPEVTRVDLAGPVLHLLTIGENPKTFPWLTAPNPSTLDEALVLLERLGAWVDGKLTPLGRQLADLPIQPRLARLLWEGARFRQPQRAALAAALLSERDPFERAPAVHETVSDILDRIEAIEQYERREAGPRGIVNRNAARNILRVRDQLARSLPDSVGSVVATESSDEAIQRALLAGFPDRLCRRREPNSPRGVQVGGRGVRIAPSSGVTRAELFLAIDVDAGQGETIVRQASAVAAEWLPAERIQETIAVEFDESSERVVAWKRRTFEGLILEQRPSHFPEDDRPGQCLLEAALRDPRRVYPPPDSEAMKFRTRVRWLREVLPDAGLPGLEDDREILSWLAPRCKSFAELRQSDWADAFRQQLTYPQRQLLDREAPEKYQVPSGKAIRIEYEEGRPPVLAVRIQELFGMTDTPRLAQGRVKMLLHLLAPNYRPQQVTDDLASFWVNTYPVVRKELRARYPKHAWPEDPQQFVRN